MLDRVGNKMVILVRTRNDLHALQIIGYTN